MIKLAIYLDVVNKTSEIPKEALDIILKHKNYKDLAAKWRGKVLNQAVEIEIVIEKFLSFYFCGRTKLKRLQFLSMFLESESNFALKIKLCCKIFKDQDDTGEYEFKRVKSYLENIRLTRNIVAHSDINTNAFLINLNKETTVFKQSFKKEGPLTLSEKTFDNFLSEASYCIDFFEEQIDILGNPLPKRVKKTI